MARGKGVDGPHPVDRYVGRRVCEKRISLGYNQSDLGRALGLTFQQIRAAAKPSIPAWRIADSIRAAFRLGLIDWTPADLPAPRVAKEPEPKDDPRQTSLFGEG